MKEAVSILVLFWLLKPKSKAINGNVAPDDYSIVAYGKTGVAVMTKPGGKIASIFNNKTTRRENYREAAAWSLKNFK